MKNLLGIILDKGIRAVMTGRDYTNSQDQKIGIDPTSKALLVQVSGGGVSVTQHSALTGLSADDHTQYLKKAGGTMTGNVILSAGTSTAGTSPIKFQSGTNLGTPENGAVEYDGSHLYITIGGTRYQIDRQSVASTTSIARTFAMMGV